MLQSINPYTGQVLKTFTEFSDSEVEIKLSSSVEAFNSWKKTGFTIRNTFLKSAAIKLLEHRKELSECITAEMGKPVIESRAEIEKCAWICDYYADHAESFLVEEPIVTDAFQSYVKFEPLGPVLGIMPWNFPFWQVFRFAVPTLAAGNSVLLKHSSNVQICASYIEKIFLDSGFPEGVYTNLVIGSGKIEGIINDPRIKAVSITGSELAGRKVAETAGRNLKKSLLELGGSNAFIILADADLQKAAEIGLKARMQNAGQSCIAAKRFIVEEKVSEEFTDLLFNEFKKLCNGDPMNENTNLGPLSSLSQAEEVERQVRGSCEKGAVIITGGHRNGTFFEPTLLTGVRPGMPVFDEEVFGPVAPVIIARDPADAVRLSNLTNFGLGVSIFTRNTQKAGGIISEFEEGAVFINSMVKSDPRLPFGGIKNSGYGRELAIQGIREFVNIKTVFINK
jgi:succinate-semialdehyde dehydrogenase/glutarate-semialdehyde dehydrogenase